MADIITPDGPVATTQGGTVYVKRYGDFSRFIPGGDCVYIGDITDELGGLNVTTRANAREGGLRRDGVLLDPPGTVSTTLSMKRLRGDKLKTRLKSCFWIFDKRTQCNDFDDPTAWSEIERVYRAKVGTRTTTPGTSIMEANAEDMINFDITALDDVDLYRLHVESAAVEAAAPHTFKCVTTCHDERCVACGDDETDAVFVAGAELVAAGVSSVYVNVANGDVGTWTDTATTWAVGDVDDIVCLGNWGVAISNGEAAAGAPVLYSRDRFTTQVYVTPAWGPTNPPLCIDAASQNYAFIGAENGHVYVSRDGGVTWDESSGGEATAQNITGIRIAPSNRQIIYAWSSAADVIIKTENGGETWFQVGLTATGGTGPLSLDVHPDDANLVICGTDAGEVFESTDGGETWTEQGELAGTTTQANVTIVDIKAAGGGVWFLGANESGVNTSRVYVNYEDGANGAWEYYNPLDGEVYNTTEDVVALAVAGPNRCVAVGGDGAAADMVALLS